MPLAARIGDTSTCPLHGAGIIVPPAGTTVTADVRSRARASDRLLCTGGIPDFIVTGSLSVQVQGFPAARKGDRTMHGGTIMTGSTGVETGGATIGVTLGNPTAALAAFNALSAGRNPPPGTVFPWGGQIPAHTIQQSYNNCGIESSRQIINRATKANVSQEVLLNEAMGHGWAHHDPGGLFESGGSTPAGRVNLLAAHGIATTTIKPDHDVGMAELQQAVAEKRGVMADVWAAKLWPAATVTNMGKTPGANDLAHSILVTGTSYDANGKLESIIINDTGLGNGSQSIPAATFHGMLIGGGNSHVVTSNPVW